LPDRLERLPGAMGHDPQAVVGPLFVAHLQSRRGPGGCVQERRQGGGAGTNQDRIHGGEVRRHGAEKAQSILDRSGQGPLVWNDRASPWLQADLYDQPSNPAPGASQVELELVRVHAGLGRGPEDSSHPPRIEVGGCLRILGGRVRLARFVPGEDEPDHVVRAGPVETLLVPGRYDVVWWAGQILKAAGDRSVVDQADEWAGFGHRGLYRGIRRWA